MKKIGVIVGRFQVPELHNGHKYLINSVLEQSDIVVFILGKSLNIDSRNPLSVEIRAAMIKEEYIFKSEKSMMFVGLEDHKSDVEWSYRLDSIIRGLEELGEVSLYGSRDCFVKNYFGENPVLFINCPIECSGTKIREDIQNTKPESQGVDFRKGIIYAIQNLK